jgi:hypothetical protein
MKVIRVPGIRKTGISWHHNKYFIIRIWKPSTASTLITAYQTLPTISLRLNNYFLTKRRQIQERKQPKCTKSFLLECEHGRTITLAVRPRPLSIQHRVRTQLKPCRLNGKQYKQCRYNVILRRVRVTIVSLKNPLSITYFECVSAILVTQHAKRILSPVVCVAVRYFSHDLINSKIFEKRKKLLINIMRILIFSATFSETLFYSNN